MVSKMLLLVGAVAVMLVLSGTSYFYSATSNKGSSSNAVEIHIQIEGGVGPGTTDHYVPANITARLGQQVTLAVANTDDNTHGLVLPQFKVDTGIIQGGSTDRVTFTADKVGTFQFYEPPGYCGGGVGNVCNSAQNMEGELTVTQ